MRRRGPRGHRARATARTAHLLGAHAACAMIALGAASAAAACAWRPPSLALSRRAVVGGALASQFCEAPAYAAESPPILRCWHESSPRWLSNTEDVATFKTMLVIGLPITPTSQLQTPPIIQFALFKAIEPTLPEPTLAYSWTPRSSTSSTRATPTTWSARDRAGARTRHWTSTITSSAPSPPHRVRSAGRPHQPPPGVEFCLVDLNFAVPTNRPHPSCRRPPRTSSL